MPRFDDTITVATLIAVISGLIGSYRGYCELRTLLTVLIAEFKEHEKQDRDEFRRVCDRLDGQRDIAHSEARRLDRLETTVHPVKRER